MATIEVHIYDLPMTSIFHLCARSIGKTYFSFFSCMGRLIPVPVFVTPSCCIAYLLMYLIIIFCAL